MSTTIGDAILQRMAALTLGSSSDQKAPVDEVKENASEFEQIIPGVFPNYKEPFFCALYGAPKSGKSWMIKFILYTMAFANKYFQFGMVFSATAAYTDDFDCMPEGYVHKFEEEAFKRYIDNLREKAQAAKQKGKKLPPNFVVLDDQIGTVKWYSPYMKEWVSTYRHTNTTVFISAQQINQGSSTVLRECCDVIMAWRPKTEDSYISYYRTMGSKFANTNTKNDEGKQIQPQQLFNQKLIDVTNVKFQCMFCLNDNRSTLEESYFSFIAPKDIPTFKLEFQTSKARPKSLPQ